MRTAKTSFFFSSAIEKENRRCACHRRERENAMLDTLYNGFAGLVGTLNDLMYSYVLIILLLAAGVYFTIRTAGGQVRLLGPRRSMCRASAPSRRSRRSWCPPRAASARAISSASPTPSPSAATARCSGCGSSLWLAARPPLSRARSRRSIKSAAPRAAATAARPTISRRLSEAGVSALFSRSR